MEALEHGVDSGPVLSEDVVVGVEGPEDMALLKPLQQFLAEFDFSGEIDGGIAAATSRRGRFGDRNSDVFPKFVGIEPFDDAALIGEMGEGGEPSAAVDWSGKVAAEGLSRPQLVEQRLPPFFERASALYIN